MYLHYHISKKDNAKQQIVFYALCVLYVLTVALIALDIAIVTAAFSISPINATVLAVSVFLFFF